MNLRQSSKDTLNGHLQSLMTGGNAVLPAKYLERAVESVRERYGNGQAGLVTEDRVEAAIVSLTKNPEPGGRQQFVLAHALAQPVKVLGGRTVLQTPIGAQLLSHWERAASIGQLKSSHWRGLFRSYMQAEQGEACQRLRKILVSSLSSLGKGRLPAPSWLSAARRHEGLLGASPCAPYVEELVDGVTVQLDDLSAEMDVPDASWFWVALREATLLQIDALEESLFKGRLDHLLSLPERIPNSRDEILAALLDRYSQCNDRMRHLQLMEFALDAWGSPQLKSNKLWAFVCDDARQMVCGWLAQEDLEDFYRLCKGARQVDDRRLRFWLRFKEQMGYTQILLGGQLRYSRDTDIRDFVHKKKGRVGDLTSGPATNNAILMQIGGWLFVEFSETGNACYAYPMGEAAIELGRGNYSLSQLKPSTKSLRRLLHMDGHETWEQKFQTSLRQVGVQPDDGMPARAKRDASVRKAPVRANPRPVVPDAYKSGWGNGKAETSAERLLERLEGLNVRVVDNRAKGGAIWAYSDGYPFPHAELRALGMTYKADREGFYWP